MAPRPQSELRPAKIITPAIRQRLQERLNQARRLSVAQPCPHEQIDAFLCECVIVDPGNTVYIGALFHHLRRSDRPRGMTNAQAPMTNKARNIGPWGLVIGHLKRLLQSHSDLLPAIRRATESQSWDEVLTLGPPALCQQPKSVDILRHLATACIALEHEQAEVCYLQAAIALAPQDAEIQRQLARAFTRQGLFDDAANAWKRLAEMLPEDEECRQTIKILCENEPPDNLTVAIAKEQMEVERAFQCGNTTLDQLGRLLLHLRIVQRYEDAQRLLDQAEAAHGPSLTMLTWREDLTLDRSFWRSLFAYKLANLRSEYQPCAERLSQAHNRLDLQICLQWSERHPNDVEVQFRLGQLLLRNRNYSEAVKQLEPFARMDKFQTEAIPALAEGWYGLRQPDKVEACIEVASALGNALVIRVLDRLKECAVEIGEFGAAREFRDRRRELVATGTGANTS